MTIHAFLFIIKMYWENVKKGRIKQKANRDVAVNCACSTKG